MAECDPIRYLDRSASSADPSFTAPGMIVCRDIRLVHTFVLDALRSGFYCPPTKLLEGNVFSRLCPSISHSVHTGFPQLWLLIVQGPAYTNLTIQGPAQSQP